METRLTAETNVTSFPGVRVALVVTVDHDRHTVTPDALFDLATELTRHAHYWAGPPVSSAKPERRLFEQLAGDRTDGPLTRTRYRLDTE